MFARMIDEAWAAYLQTEARLTLTDLSLALTDLSLALTDLSLDLTETVSRLVLTRTCL